MPSGLTRRQSQRPSLSRLVLTYELPKGKDRLLNLLLHEPRQRRSWLIFDVRQKLRHSKVARRDFVMKPPIIVLSGLCLAAVVGYAASAMRDIPFEITSQQFEAGDSIILERVIATSPEFKVGDTVVVRGRYHLQSRPQAKL